MKSLTYEGFDNLQTQAINYAYFSLGLSENEMKFIVRKELSAPIMYMIIDYFEQNEGEDACEEFKEIVEPYIRVNDFSENQIDQIMDGFSNCLSTEEIDLYAKPEFDDFQMSVIKDGLIEGLSIAEVKTFANPAFSTAKMEIMRRHLIAEKKKEERKKDKKKGKKD